MKSLIEFYYPQYSASDRYSYIHKLQPTNTTELPPSDDIINAIATVMKHENPLISSPAALSAVEYLWTNDKKVRSAFEDAEVQKNNVVDESSEYFWSDLERIKAAQYIPDETDIVSVRFRTTGIIEARFAINESDFVVVDVGGQKSERKKWLSVFGGVSAVLFVVSLSAYNEQMYEDLQKNQMIDALELFQFVCDHREFQSTHIILFLNKRDIFERKITRFPITECPAFADFFETATDDKVISKDPSDYTQCTQYIAQKFRALAKNQEHRQLTAHITCAKDRKNIQMVFNDVQKMIVKEYLFKTGF
jgi:hypothetical protein